ncbi:hypothetical protein DIS24_g9245 [Lasiodiplodia hormozganensis]|uniref:Uncharacterized protein n=1 Tax=Lasiodiplodia hormozganensis TaxID=869390 RepID=A0AA39XUK7_9PEZI|nr:hypothetical protein DIS24_g9245 [Lasiodiplodia hormozganensis]
MVLAAGVHYSSIWLALSGRVLEGCATDNVLQLVLNTLYLRASEQTQVSRLFGLSLALFMVGQGLSPIISGLFADFRASFAMATLLFGLCFSYTWLLPTACIPEEQPAQAGGVEDEDRPQTKTTPATVLLLHPLRAAVRTRALWAPEAALLLFLAATSYLYPAILVFASTRHGFTAAQNGWIVSLTAASCSCSLLAVHVVWPRLRGLVAAADPDPVNNEAPSRARVAFDANYRNAAASMLLLAAVCPAIGLTTRAWQVYALAAVAALGLSAPAFVKSHAVGLLVENDDDDDRTQALTALALMETCGALLSPVVLGVAAREDGSSVFFVAAALVVAALAVLTGGAVDVASGGGGRRVRQLWSAGAFLSVTDDAASARLGTRADVLLEPEDSGRVRAGWLSN